ncbi:hypothetical protein BCR44DRAFT_33832 [Catenaria anguillulae PL171]|uniref:Uncharacterized protein n=1 Tax=Catenaria anguillulae PL171 TaxID=765915 RepID=A0A1Y2HQA5_9FUNG|nr:hypothetical protein BCR44DRAFT_33832 [Catenaria anguillulae PL171]
MLCAACTQFFNTDAFWHAVPGCGRGLCRVCADSMLGGGPSKDMMFCCRECRVFKRDDASWQLGDGIMEDTVLEPIFRDLVRVLGRSLFGFGTAETNPLAPLQLALLDLVTETTNSHSIQPDNTIDNIYHNPYTHEWLASELRRAQERRHETRYFRLPTTPPYLDSVPYPGTVHVRPAGDPMAADGRGASEDDRQAPVPPTQNVNGANR